MRISAFRFCCFLVATFLTGVTAAAAETADDLVAKNLAARGGAAKLASIASMEFTGKLVAPGGFELAYKETRARKGNAARVESSIEGLTLVQGFDGHTGWRINPFEGRRDAERMSDDDTLAFADDATIDGALLLAKAGSGSVTYLGREDFDGTDTYKLLVVKPDGARYTYFLDPDTYLEVKVVEERERRGSRDVTLFELGDYELVDGVYFPFEIEAGSLASTSADRQQIRIASAQANVPAPDSLFAMPVTPGAK